MELVLFTLCDACEVISAGRFAIIGAAPEFWAIPSLPATTLIHVAVVVGLEPEEADDTVSLRLLLSSEADGVQADITMELGPTPRNPDVYAAGSLVHRSVGVGIELTFQNVGPHRLEAFDTAGNSLACRRFGVKLASA